MVGLAGWLAHLERLVVGDGHVLGPAAVLEEGVLGAHTGVVQA